MSDSKRKSPKAILSIQYVVHKKEQVDDLKARFDAFMKRCDIYDRGPDAGLPIPVILAQEPDTKTLVINLDPSCEVAVYDFESLAAVVHDVNELKFVFKGGNIVKIRVSMMGAACEI